MDVIQEYTEEREDLARIIAQMTSGGKGAVPEQADFILADEVILFIENKVKGE